jgi:hypothetical protein
MRGVCIIIISMYDDDDMHYFILIVLFLNLRYSFILTLLLSLRI